jgi:hypothetical protein
MSVWPKLLTILVVGYLTMTRSFAYLGIPPAKLFVGELAIGTFIITRPGAIFRRWTGALAQPSPIGAFAVSLAVFLGYGWLVLVRGLMKDYPTILALQGFAFHYYPICFFMGLWAGLIDRTMLRRTIRIAAWFNGIYGLLYIAFLNRILVPVPGTVDVPIFGQPAGSAILVLGLLCLEPRLSKVWHLLLLNLVVMLGLQVRAEYLGFALGLVLWCMLTRRLERLFAAFAAVAMLLVLGLITDLRVPAPTTRGGHISTREIVGRVIAPFDPELAGQFDPDAKSQAGTAEWRVKWWSKIWEETHQDTETAFLGQGYGYPLAELVGYKERDIRTPHSVFFYCLAYGGWIGVGVFFALQFALARTLWHVWRRTGNPFGLVIWIMFFSGAFFGNAYEAPFGAVPFYLLVGIAAAPLCAGATRVTRYANPARTYLLQTAGR